MAYAITIERCRPQAWFDCQGQDERFAACCESLALPLPAGAGQVSTADPLALLPVAPRHWLLRAPRDQEQRLLDWANGYRDDDQLSIVWVSDQYCGFALHGEEVEEVLAQASPIDTSASAFPAGAAWFTDVFGTRGLICRERDEQRYSLYVERSYGDYVEAWLAAASGRPRWAGPAGTEPPE